jgi:DNA polymerase-1
MNRIYLIDGMSVVFRAYHAMLRSGLSNSKGELTGAIFGFVNIFTSLIEKESPDRIAVVFDTHYPTFRKEMYPEYKANRDEFPEELVPQLEKIKEFLDIISVPRIELNGYEADDIIGTLSIEAASKDLVTIILTSDKDLYQLVNDKVKLYKPSRKPNEDFDIVNIPEVKEKFGVTPEQVIDILALIGDTSDNIPGVKGIGIKSAMPLVQEYGSLESIYENIDKITKTAIKNKLLEHKDIAFLSKKLVTIKLDVPLDTGTDSIQNDTPDYQKLDEFFAAMEFRTIREKWRKRAEHDSTFDKGIIEQTGTIDDEKHKYQLIDTLDAVKELAERFKKAELLSVDLETSEIDRLYCEIVGIALSDKERTGFYIPVYGKSKEQINRKKEDDQNLLFAIPDKEEDDENEIKGKLKVYEVLDILKPVFDSSEIKKCGQNIKYDAFILMRYGVELKPIVFDSMLASYVLNPYDKHNLDALSEKWLNYKPIPISSLIGEKKSKQKSMKSLDPKDIVDYASEDADLALRLRNILFAELKKENLLKLAEDLEFPLVEVLTRMEYNGVAIDTDALKDISSQIKANTKELSEKIIDEAGTKFNIDSTQQLSHILFEKLMIPPVKKTKTGYSTDVQVLTQLAETYPIAEYVLEYRQLKKLLSTYVEALPKLIYPPTGRIHTTFNQTVAATGRLSSTDPNLQNIPIRSDLGKEIRRAFVPKDRDGIIFSADYSQVELRIMAYICGDKQLIESFKNGLDIHSATASRLFNVELDKVDQDMRRIAKTVNFGIMYGLGSYGLSQRLSLDRKESKDIIDNYFEKYPGIRKYIDQTIEFTEKNGFAETLLGRRRFFPDINSSNNNLKTAAERGAINMPIQGTASDMMKIAMISIDKEMRKRKMKSLMMIQVHDELVFEVLNDELDELRDLVKEKMENALSLGDVPVVVDTGIGKNWFEAH